MDTKSLRMNDSADSSEDEGIERDGFEDSVDAIKKTSDDEKEIKAIRVSRKRAKFTDEHLISKDGLPRIYKSCQRLSFKGVGHEKEDLKLLVRTYEEWGAQLFPRLAFADLINQVKNMGRQRSVKEWVEWVKNGNDPDTIPTISFLGQEQEFPEPETQSAPTSPQPPFDEKESENQPSLLTRPTRTGDGPRITMPSTPTISDSLQTLSAHTTATDVLTSADSAPSVAVLSLAPTLTTEQIARMERNRLEAIKRLQEKRKADL